MTTEVCCSTLVKRGLRWMSLHVGNTKHCLKSVLCFADVQSTVTKYDFKMERCGWKLDQQNRSHRMGAAANKDDTETTSCLHSRGPCQQQISCCQAVWTLRRLLWCAFIHYVPCDVHAEAAMIVSNWNEIIIAVKKCKPYCWFCGVGVRVPAQAVPQYRRDCKQCRSAIHSTTKLHALFNWSLFQTLLKLSWKHKYINLFHKS